MKNPLLIAASLTLLLALSGCASPSKPIPVVVSCPQLPPVPAAVMRPRQPLSPGVLQQDLLGDTPTTTK